VIDLRSERGQTLVLVLVLVMAFSLVVTAVVGLASATATANQRTSGIVRQREAAEAATEYGIQAVKGGAVKDFNAIPVPTATTAPVVNGEGAGVTITQRNVTALVVSGPAVLASHPITQPYVAQFTENATTYVLPYGVTWAVVSGAGATITQSGVLTATAAATVVISATLANATATLSITVN
jgi:hypothetical protein